MKYTLFLSIALLFACNNKPKETDAQTDNVDPIIERWQPTEYRNENWHPEDGKYFFSEQWVWHFINESLAEEDPHREGDFSVFIDPSTGTMMLNRAESHYQDEMTDWIIINADGTYLSGWTDHDGSKSMQQISITDFADHAFRLAEQQQEFEEFFSHTGEYAKFGENQYGWETFTGKEWIQTYKMTDEESTVYTTSPPFSVRPLYLVEQTNGDLRLPINFRDYAYLLPADELVLKEMSEFYGMKVGFEFKSMSPVSHFFDVNGYDLVK